MQHKKLLQTLKIGEDGGIEIKCPDSVKFFRLLIGEDKPDEAYIWQCQI